MRLVADTSAWIEFVKGTGSALDKAMISAIDDHAVLVPDLVYLEVLRGIPTEAGAAKMTKKFEPFLTFDLCNIEIARVAAKHYRYLRSKAFTVRGTVDLLLATWCIENNVPLLHADRDFEGFEKYLGLKRWRVAV